jgi:hypothetical protein
MRFVRGVAWSRLGDWSYKHGATIDPDALSPCDRAVYAASPYASLRGPNVSEITVRTFGPHWVIPLCGRAREVQVVVSFSALAMELAASLDSAHRPPPWERSEIRSSGFPVGAGGAMYSPEGAALFAFNATGKRVNSIPELVMSPMPSAPMLVRWRLNLESPVTVTGAHSALSRQRSSLLVGFGNWFKSSGLLDSDPQGAPAQTSWIDVQTKAPFTVVLAPNVPEAVEIVTRGNP